MIAVPYAVNHAAISHSTYAYAVRRWEATVQAVEAERDAERERSEDWMRRGLAAVERAEAAEEQAELRAAIQDYLTWSRPDHPCAVIFRDAIADDDAARGEG